MTDEWITRMDLLRDLERFAEDEGFQGQWTAIKQANKRKLVEWIKRQCGVEVDENTMFDIHIKRIHEYKRQLMNILYVIHRYTTIKAMTPEQRSKVVPRTIMFGGKAAPGYEVAKWVIKLINEVSLIVNADEVTKNLLKVVFIPNYNVSAAEVIIPATELSQHISLAGT
jgi:starch phosphorylase